MADDDEIDILGDFSFNSCFAQNNQGIPSCSSREDTVHPQWLLDSSETNNWYDKQSKDSLQSLRNYSGPSRRLLGDHSLKKHNIYPRIVWTQAERNTLAQEMVKYGRNIKKISQTLKTKTEAEIQALIDAEFGLHIETTSQGIDKFEDHADIPSVVREEIVTDDSHIKKAVTITPAAAIATHQFYKKSFKVRSKNTLLKPNPYEKTELIDSSEIFYEDDMIIGSTESIGSELDTSDKVYKNIAKHQAKVKAEKKIGNHRRKVSRNYDKGARSLLKSPPGRQRKDSSLSDDSVKSPKMQIVLGSGQALPIKIEKKKESEPESDIEIDIDSDDETKSKPKAKPDAKLVEEPIAVPLRKFEPMPRRQKKINLAPYDVRLHVSTLILMDGHAHTSRGEVMGLTGGAAAGRCVTVSAYIPAAAAAGSTHCDMDPGPAVAARPAARARVARATVGLHHLAALAAGPPRLAVQDEAGSDTPVGYQFSVKLVADLTPATLPAFLRELRAVLRRDDAGNQMKVDLLRDVCPQARMTYLEKEVE
ncbi:putative myb-like, SWIRM and MPN domains 1 [Operophtera brumata]|uniref:Putative myb-like, SWIRM and MPN domains 1 n=1 Tax=Operophtera brumata TaxID=104452 RepID=A0A0L7L0R6_OPEBR|nr:putative myb-like, SWIRM and MPN domains 1 [Operophtera brumata]